MNAKSAEGGDWPTDGGIDDTIYVSDVETSASFPALTQEAFVRGQGGFEFA